MKKIAPPFSVLQGDLGPIMHETGSLKLTWSNGCIEVIVKMFNNLSVTFSNDGNDSFLASIVGK